jgi:hypothetical protein
MTKPYTILDRLNDKRVRGMPRPRNRIPRDKTWRSGGSVRPWAIAKLWTGAPGSGPLDLFVGACHRALTKPASIAARINSASQPTFT